MSPQCALMTVLEQSQRYIEMSFAVVICGSTYMIALALLCISRKIAFPGIHAKQKPHALIPFEARFLNLATVEFLIPIHAKQKPHALIPFEARLMTGTSRLSNP